jgi:cytochrome d ubiquinol oxidase subunit I
MTAIALSRWQFAITTVYHFFFVPLTLGLSILVALMETMYVRTGNETYKRMTKFWGKLFLINFAVGVVTGIVMEFQFGMNWSEYSRFVGDVFGVPLAIEALLAFFLESTFLGIWIFGWDLLPKALHAAVMWLVAIGSNLSAFWILVANSFMQEPLGFVLRNGRAELTDFGALVTNPHVWVQFPHVFFAGLTTAAFFVLGISGYHLLRDKDHDLFRRSFHWGVVAGLAGAVLVGLVGHTQMQHLNESQPMKLAAAEALWDTEQPASLSLFTIGTLSGDAEVWSIRVPYLMSLLTCNNLDCAVRGMNDLQAEYEQAFGPGDYVPFTPLIYWSFRAMMTAGLLMIGVGGYALYLVMRDRLDRQRWFLRLLPLAIALPYLANTTGWILAEAGRQPWIVQGLMRTEEGISTAVPLGAIALSLTVFTLLYGALMAADVFLLGKYARQESSADEEQSSPEEEQSSPAAAYS